MKDNKLIAEFMELEASPKYNPEEYINMYQQYTKYKEYNSGEWCLPEEMKYHESWDWLMPVVQKCFKVSRTYNIVDNKEGFNNLVVAAANIDCLLRSLTYPFIGGTYKAVVEFIKNYNKYENK